MAWQHEEAEELSQATTPSVGSVHTQLVRSHSAYTTSRSLGLSMGFLDKHHRRREVAKRPEPIPSAIMRLGIERFDRIFGRFHPHLQES